MTGDNISKLEVLNNTYREGTFTEEKGMYYATFGFQGKQVADFFQGMGLKAGNNFVHWEYDKAAADLIASGNGYAQGDPKAGEIMINPAALPDPQKATDKDFTFPPAQANEYMAQLTAALGIPVQAGPMRYSGDKAHPFTRNLAIKMDDPHYANQLTDVIVRLRHEMGIPKADLPIYPGKDIIMIAPADIQKYDQANGTGAFIKKLQETMNKVDIEAKTKNETFKQEIQEYDGHFIPAPFPQQSNGGRRK